MIQLFDCILLKEYYSILDFFFNVAIGLLLWILEVYLHNIKRVPRLLMIFFQISPLIFR